MREERRLLIVVTHPMTADLLMRGQLRYLLEQGWRVGVVSSPGPQLDTVAAREGCTPFPVPMARAISPFADLGALYRLARVVREFQPDVVSAGTPKAGLLGTLAAFLMRVPQRVYVLRGLRLETARGWRRRLLTMTERVAARLATKVVCVSPSLRSRCLDLRLARAEKVTVLGSGSSNGVDTARFAPGDAPASLVPFPPDIPVIGFVGRFTHDKGIADLLAAFARLRLEMPGLVLLLVGDHEEGDPVSPRVTRQLAECSEIHVIGFVQDTAPYYRRMSVLAFPSAREGLPNAPLEAAASAVPTVAYRATGTIDAVVDGRTGAIVEQGDVEALAEALLRYLEDPELAANHGREARERVLEEFRSEIVWQRWASFYASLLP